MNSRWEAVCSCGSQGKVGNVLAQANPHQNQQIVRGFGMFVGKTEIGNFVCENMFFNRDVKEQQNPAKSGCVEITQPLIKMSPCRDEGSILLFALV